MSIVVPVFGRPDKFARAMASIAAQNVWPREVIVVDDGSSPAVTVPAMPHGLTVRLIRHDSNRGAAAARNSGLDTAEGDWVTFLDCDDWLLTDSLGTRWRLLEKARATRPSEFAAYACGWTDVDEAGGLLRARFPREADDVLDFASGCWFSPGSCIFLERTAVQRLGIRQDESLRRFEDLDWFLALAMKGLVLRLLPTASVAIERSRVQDPEIVEHTARQILAKWAALGAEKQIQSRLAAYLHLECAAAYHFAGAQRTALAFLARSVAATPRLSIQLSPGWTRRTLPLAFPAASD